MKPCRVADLLPLLPVSHPPAGQAFLSMLCSMKYLVFLFFASWNIFMTLLVYFLLPGKGD